MIAAKRGRAANLIAIVLIALYAALVAVTAANHEQWYDEVHTWLVARDSTLFEMLWTNLRYDGTPALWYLVLFVPAHVLHAPLWTIQAIAAAAAVAGVAIFLLCSPFPWPIRVLVPFGYFIAYQYSVVARSYSLFVPLIFGVAAVYPRRRRCPFAYATLLALLANLSGHTFMVALGLALLETIDLARNIWQRGQDPSPASSTPLGKPEGASLERRAAALALVAVAGMVAVAVVYPPPDMLDPPPLVSVAKAIPRAAAYVSNFLTPWPALSLVLWSATLWWMWQTRTLSLYLFPTVGALLLIGFKYVNRWHEGILLLVWIAALWQSFDPKRGGDRFRSVAARQLARRCVVGCVALVLSIHVYWAARAITNDLRYPYSGARDAARYILDRGLHRHNVWTFTINEWNGFQPLTLLPYFEQNIYDNYYDRKPPAYWRFFRGPPPRRSAWMDAHPPDVVVVGLKTKDQPGAQRGYRVAARFPGQMFWKAGVMEEDSYVIIVRDRLP